MRNEQLFDEFIAFCDSQPKDKVIDHSCWSTCALGEFASYKNLILSSWSGWFSFTKEVLGDDELRDKVEKHGEDECPSNYGEFTEFLKNYK